MVLARVKSLHAEHGFMGARWELQAEMLVLSRMLEHLIAFYARQWPIPREAFSTIDLSGVGREDQDHTEGDISAAERTEKNERPRGRPRRTAKCLRKEYYRRLTATLDGTSCRSDVIPDARIKRNKQEPPRPAARSKVEAKKKQNEPIHSALKTPPTVISVEELHDLLHDNDRNLSALGGVNALFAMYTKAALIGSASVSSSGGPFSPPSTATSSAKSKKEQKNAGNKTNKKQKKVLASGPMIIPPPAAEMPEDFGNKMQNLLNARQDKDLAHRSVFGPPQQGRNFAREIFPRCVERVRVLREGAAAAGGKNNVAGAADNVGSSSTPLLHFNHDIFPQSLTKSVFPSGRELEELSDAEKKKNFFNPAPCEFVQHLSALLDSSAETLQAKVRAAMAMENLGDENKKVQQVSCWLTKHKLVEDMRACEKTSITYLPQWIKLKCDKGIVAMGDRDWPVAAMKNTEEAVAEIRNENVHAGGCATETVAAAGTSRGTVSFIRCAQNIQTNHITHLMKTDSPCWRRRVRPKPQENRSLPA